MTDINVLEDRDGTMKLWDPAAVSSADISTSRTVHKSNSRRK